CTTMKSW
nr:immunoglobulin heavy chain junction region [Macaca mulatta]